MSKIYKYTSLSSAIKIIKSKKILLNNPTKFNDPFDCAFEGNTTDEKKSFELILNYCAIKIFLNLINDNNLCLTKIQKVTFKIIKAEISIIQRLLNINPHYSKIPLINKFIKSIVNSRPELKEEFDKFSENFKHIIKENIEKAKNSALVSCFSRRNDSILMWSHYADSHRGVCLEFDKPEQEEFKTVEYTNKKPSIKMYNLISSYIAHDFIGKQMDSSNFEYIKNLVKPFFVKSKEWSYEEEIRCLFSTKDSENNKITCDGENYFVDVGKIKKIYIGSKARGVEIDEIIKLAKNRKIEVIFMKESIKDFKIIPDLNHIHKKSIIINEETNSILGIIKEIESALNKELYVSAFVLALNIPAICGAKAYPNYDEEKQYKKWAHEWFCQYEKGSNEFDDRFPYQSADLLFDIRNEYFNHGTFNVYKNYPDFKLDQFILRIESKKTFNAYVGKSNITKIDSSPERSELTINVREFCQKITELGQKFYHNNINLFDIKDNIVIEDYDKELDEYREFLVLNNQDK